MYSNRRPPGTDAKAWTVQEEERHSEGVLTLLFCRDHQSHVNQGRRQALRSGPVAVTTTVTRTGPSHSAGEGADGAKPASADCRTVPSGNTPKGTLQAPLTHGLDGACGPHCGHRPGCGTSLPKPNRSHRTHVPVTC